MMSEDINKWVDAFSLPIYMYEMYMSRRKNRRKARYYKKLERLKKRLQK